MKLYKIREYKQCDAEAIKNICIAVGNEQFKTNKLLQKACTRVFVEYYINEEPENCFVAVDSEDRPVGYILSTADFDKWVTLFRKKYLRGLNPLTKMLGEGSIKGLEAHAREYPAHLHIDILPDYQGCGIGRTLLEALTTCLRQKGIEGIQLNVAADNSGAISYYEKMGFNLLEKNEQVLTYGMRLSE